MTREGRQLQVALEDLLEVNFRGAATGTGIDAPESYRAAALAALMAEASLLSAEGYAAPKHAACTVSTLPEA